MIKNIKSIILILGTFLVLTAASTSKSDYYNEVAKSQKLIMDVYKYTVNNYADKINLEVYTRSSITNMVESLDLYTVYMEEEEKQNIDMLTKGKYGGVGMEISKRQMHKCLRSLDFANRVQSFFRGKREGRTHPSHTALWASGALSGRQYYCARGR